jgi:hypothetical protein
VPAAHASDPSTTLFFRTNPGDVNPPLYLSPVQGTISFADSYSNVAGMTNDGQLKNFLYLPLVNPLTASGATFTVNLANNGNKETLDITVVLTKNGVTVGTTTLAGQSIAGAGAQKQFAINIANVDVDYKVGDVLDCGVKISNVFDTFKNMAGMASDNQLLYNGNAPGNANASLCQITTDVAVFVPEFSGSSPMIAVAFGSVALLAMRLVMRPSHKS